MIYGRVVSEKKSFWFDQQVLTKLQKLHFKNQGSCNNCNLKLLCGGGCPMRNLQENGFPPKPSSYICQIEHLFLPKILSLIAQDQIYRRILLDDVEIEVC